MKNRKKIIAFILPALSVLMSGLLMLHAINNPQSNSLIIAMAVTGFLFLLLMFVLLSFIVLRKAKSS